MAEAVPSARPFSLTGAEWKAQVADKRAALAKNWPNFKPLVVPSAYSYDFGGFQTAYQNFDSWFPTPQQKAAEIAKLPYIASENFTRVATDPRPYSFTFVRRPSYYAIFNAGKIRRGPEWTQSYGLGLLWNPQMGTVMQSVANTEWLWGTKSEGAAKVAETKDLLAQTTIGDVAVSVKPGQTNYAVAPVQAIYALDGGGRKTVQMNADGISVNVNREGGFVEHLPLLKPTSATLTQAPGRLTMQSGKTAFVVSFDPAVEVEIQPAKPFQAGLERVMVTLKSQHRLNYRLSFSPAN